jgi:hypothetical protein
LFIVAGLVSILPSASKRSTVAIVIVLDDAPDRPGCRIFRDLDVRHRASAANRRSASDGRHAEEMRLRPKRERSMESKHG